MTPHENTTLVERTIEWIVDRDGDSYGDERERLRYYEAHSAMLTAQTYLLPVVASITIAVAGRRSIGPVLAVTSVPLVLAFVGLAYLRREHVAVADNARRVRARGAVYVAAYLTLPLAILWRSGASSARVLGVAAGLVVGASACAFVALRRSQRAAS